VRSDGVGFKTEPLSDPDVLILDKAFGIQAILDWLAASSGSEGKSRAGIVIWGASVTEAEALRFLQAGARGILRKSAGPQRSSPACGRLPGDACGCKTVYFVAQSARTATVN
jgi:DNA-binding NarL/FixJ family response regulator